MVSASAADNKTPAALVTSKAAPLVESASNATDVVVDAELVPKSGMA